MTLVNAGGARFAGKVSVQDAAVTMTRPTIWENGTLEVTGSKPFTITDGYISKGAKVNINTSGDVSVATTNFWNEGNEANSALVIGEKSGKVMLNKNVFHNSQSNGVVNIQGGTEVKLHTNSFVDMKAAENPFVISNSITTLDVRANNITYVDESVVDSTALCRFQKKQETTVKEFDKTKLTFNADNKANGTKYAQTTSGLQTAFVVFSNKNNKITSDNPTVNWV